MDEVQVQVYGLMREHFVNSITDGLKSLFENKHLYQNLNITFPEFQIIYDDIKDYSPVHDITHANREKYFRYIYDHVPEFPWLIKNPYGRRGIGYLVEQPGSDEFDISIDIEPPTVKLFCPICEDIEPYNFRHGEDLLGDFRYSDNFGKSIPTQIFVMLYQCQACKSLPEAFLVRRETLKLTLSGRTPIEKVQTPKFLPKDQKKYFSDAIVAFNSGQVLASNFLLRTFVEQYVRSKNQDPESRDIDAIFQVYNETLPDDFKLRFPSLKYIYDKLSDDIHGAVGSEKQFHEAKQDIETHFDAKRIYKID